jgi:hypothetical protein
LPQLRIALARVHTPAMTPKGAALLAFIGTLVITAFLTWTFFFHMVNVLRGVEPPVVLFSWLIYAFGAFTLTAFFFVFHRRQP